MVQLLPTSDRPDRYSVVMNHSDEFSQGMMGHHLSPAHNQARSHRDLPPTNGTSSIPIRDKSPVYTGSMLQESLVIYTFGSRALMS